MSIKKIAIDLSPVKNAHSLRGIGFYTKNLISSLKKKSQNTDFIIEETGNDGWYDLIHHPYFDLFSRTLKINKNFKTVVTVHDVTPLVFPKNYPLGLKAKINLEIQKFLLGKTDKIITDSENSKKDLIKYLNLPADKIAVIYLAAGDEFKVLDKGEWVEEIVEKFRLPKRYVLYVGDVGWNKNILNLAKAISEANLNLVMVGKETTDEEFDRNHPENKDRSEFFAQFAKDPKIIRLGFVLNEDLVKIYNLATVYCQPSFYEGFGLPILEAMSAGCPVICSRSSSLPEVAQEAALYFDPTNVKDISEKLQKVINDKNLQKELRGKGLVQAKKFSWSKTAEETLKIYEEVLSSK